MMVREYVLLGIACSLSSAAADEGLSRQAVQMLQQHCLRCHNGETTRGGLDLSTRDTLLQGGATSDAVNLEHPERSPLLERATAGTMPPERDGRRLQPAELATLLQWLQAGAQWPKPVALQVPPSAVGLQWEAQVLPNSSCQTNPPAAQVVYPLAPQHRGGGLRFRRKR